MREGDDKCVLELPEEAANGYVIRRELHRKVSLEENKSEMSYKIHTGHEDEGQEGEGIKHVAHGSVYCSLKL